MGRAIKNWIQGAIKNPGSLKKALNVPKDKDIPAKKLEKAIKKSFKVHSCKCRKKQKAVLRLKD